MHRATILIIATAFTQAIVPAVEAAAQDASAVQLSAPLGYADLADMALVAPIASGVVVRKAAQVRSEGAAGVAAGMARMLVQADVQSLIRGAEGLPGSIRYLVDVPADRKGHGPKLKKARFLLLAAPVPGRMDEVRLIGPKAQIPWTADNEARLRAILVAASAADAPPRVTGISSAFHVPGSLPGESETQIFLTTATGQPISLAILRRPGETPRWAVALGEMVDDSAAPPPRDSLLWYRLACGLPAALPDAVTADMEGAAADAVRDDYRLVQDGLGVCRPA